MLTDKAKIEFESYYNSSTSSFLLNGIDFDDLPLCVKNALIIEWFDSIGIYITIKNKFGQNKQARIFWFSLNRGASNNEVYLSRLEATKKAIEKANEIYNI